MAIPQLATFEMSYSLKRRHIYIVLGLIYYFGLDDLSTLFFFIILFMASSDMLDGLFERIWMNDKDRVKEYGRNWWRGALSMFYKSLSE